MRKRVRKNKVQQKEDLAKKVEKVEVENVEVEKVEVENVVERNQEGQAGEPGEAEKELPEEIEGELCAVTSAEGVIELPPEFFNLKALSDILNIETWQYNLDERDRSYLRFFLPKGLDEGRGGELDKIFQEKENINFGNPCAKFMRDILAGQCHPKVIKYKNVVIDMQYSSFFHRIRDYHNDMIFNLLKQKEEIENANHVNGDIAKPALQLPLEILPHKKRKYDEEHSQKNAPQKR